MTSTVTYQVRAWLPIRTTVFNDDECAAVVDAGISSFLNELPEALPMIFSEIQNVQVVQTDPPEGVAAYIARTSSLHRPPLFQCVCVIADAVFLPRESEAETTDHVPNVELADAAYYLGRALDIALDLSELSSPGCIWAVEGAVVIREGIYAQTSAKRFFGALHPRAEFPAAWPPVVTLPLTRVVRWAKAVGMLSAPLAESRLQRVLAAYTNLVGLETQGDNEPLFRAMQALEAFYCDGVGDLRRQLAEKTRVWLGQHDGTTNIVGQLYDVRSKFVHGSAKLEYRHSTADPWEHDEKTMFQLSSGASFATRLLVASLQRCVVEQVIDLSWPFGVTPIRNASDA